MTIEPLLKFHNEMDISHVRISLAQQGKELFSR